MGKTEWIKKMVYKTFSFSLYNIENNAIYKKEKLNAGRAERHKIVFSE
jgi:hypothetical protein